MTTTFLLLTIHILKALNNPMDECRGDLQCIDYIIEAKSDCASQFNRDGFSVSN